MVIQMNLSQSYSWTKLMEITAVKMFWDKFPLKDIVE